MVATCGNGQRQHFDVSVLGPGLNREDVVALFECASSSTKLVIDAGALRALAEGAIDLADHQFERLVLTPHPGEAAALLGTDTLDIARDRLSAAQRIADKYCATVILKGAQTVVAYIGELPYIIDVQAPALAVGGTGDVLSGVLAVFINQMEAFDAAAAAALVHALAGRALGAARGTEGILAREVADQIAFTAKRFAS